VAANLLRDRDLFGDLTEHTRSCGERVGLKEGADLFRLIEGQGASSLASEPSK
jgi:hypothetical protein